MWGRVCFWPRRDRAPSRHLQTTPQVQCAPSIQTGPHAAHHAPSTKPHSYPPLALHKHKTTVPRRPRGPRRRPLCADDDAGADRQGGRQAAVRSQSELEEVVADKLIQTFPPAPMAGGRAAHASRSTPRCTFCRGAFDACGRRARLDGGDAQPPPASVFPFISLLPVNPLPAIKKESCNNTRTGTTAYLLVTLHNTA